jgi:hypothetical protein
MNIRAALVLMIPLTTANGATAQTDTASANWIMPGCRAFIDDGRRMEAHAFTAGVCVGRVDILLLVGRGLPSDARFCPPKGVTRQQAIRVAIAYIDARPGQMHEPFAFLAMAAFQEAWPCRP